MLKSQTAIPALGIQGQSFTILRSWFDAEVTKTTGGITYDPEPIRASERGNDMDAFAAELLGLGGTGLVSPTLQKIYAGRFPDVVATVFTSISAALNKPYNRDHFSVLSEEQAEQLAREREQRAENEKKRRSIMTRAPFWGQKGYAVAQKFAQQQAFVAHIRERFVEVWDQPTNIPETTDFVTSLLVRIESDGRISHLKVVRSSGNAVMDESVINAASRVSKVNPPPASLMWAGTYYEVTINFTLE